MGGVSKGKAIFPLNVGVKDTDITDDNDAFDYAGHAAKKSEAYLNVSVNPTLVQNNLQYENSQNGSSLKSSANFMEIRDTSHGGSVSNDSTSRIGNRIYPSNATLTDHALNRDETHSFKVKVYDSQLTNSETNRKFVYSTSDYPATEEVGLDIENYDYFILLNPDTVVMGTDAIRPHFAKVTRIISFDEFGDGIEFSPAYPTEVGINTKFEIYKGPAKTATDIVAVSYGLRGDALSNTNKHDRVSHASRPTWYFYNDRLDEKDQLDYMTKYNLTHLRYWSAFTTVSMNAVTSHAQYAIGSDSIKFTVTDVANRQKLLPGMSIFDNSGVYLGNIKTLDDTNNLRVKLDYARVLINQNNSQFNVKIGKTIQNVIFRTEGKFNNTIHSLGKDRLEATLVDANKTSDDSTSSDFYKWENAFPKMHRHTANSDSTSTLKLDGDLTGPGKYLTFEKANYKNNQIPLITHALLNQPRNKMSQLAQFKVMDNSGLQHLKMKEETDLILERNIYNGSMQFMKFHGKASRHSSNTSTIVLKDIKKNTDLRAVLGAGPNANTIVEIDGYYYVVNVVNAQSNGEQSFTIKNKKTIAANTWTGSSVAENFSSKEMKVAPYTGVLNTTLEPDTEFDLDSSRLSMSDVTIDENESKLYNSRLVIGTHNRHDNRIQYGDKDNKYLKIQDDSRVFYQRSNENKSRFYYYNSSYSISDVAFTGVIEDITSASENGLTTYNVVGRDETSKLLSQTVSKNTTFMEDVIHTSLPPILNATAITGISSLSVTTGSASVTFSGTPSTTPAKYGLILNQAGELLGEVKQYSSGTITLYDGAFSTPTTTSSLKYYHPYSSTWVNYVTGTKALGSNEQHNTGTASFTSISEKAIDFNSGLSLTLDGNTFVYTAIRGSSNTGSYLKDGTLGYDISSPKAISTNDAIFAFNAGNENGVTLDKIDVASISKETFDVVKVNEKDESETRLSLSPIFPILLGRVDINSSDTRGNCNLYLVNNNADTGGFIHRLQSTASGTGYFGPKETMRYWDLQRFDRGPIYRNHDSIYRFGSKPQMVTGYAVAYGVKADGSLMTLTATGDSKPLSGSNTIKGWTYVANFFGSQSDYPIVESYPTIREETNVSMSGYVPSGLESDIQYDSFEQIDPRAETYELLATGDVFPYSKLRHNNLGYHTKDYKEFGVLLESEPTLTGETTHQHYVGKTKQTLQTENMFEESSIQTSTQTTNQMRRFGVMKLVEATFDWHFNPVDYESLPDKAEDIPTVKTFDYVQFCTPVAETSTNSISWDNDGVYTTSNVGASDGRVFYQKSKIGAYPASAYGNIASASGINGFVALNQDTTMSSTRWIINSINDVLGASSATGLLRYDGGTHASGLLSYFGVQPFRLFGTTDFNIDNLTTHTGSTKLKFQRRSNAHNIRFSHVWLCTPTVDSSNFKWAKTLKSSTGFSTRFEGHDIILPIVSEEHAGTWSGSPNYDFIREPNKKDRRLSAHTHFSTGTHKHISRVIAGLYHRELSDTDSDLRFRFGVGQTANNSASLAHIYEGCIGVFRGFKQGSTVMAENFGTGVIDNDDIVMSTVLSLTADSGYNTFITNNTSDYDQVTRNLMIQRYPKNVDTLHLAYDDGDTTMMLNVGGYDTNYGVSFNDHGYGFIGDSFQAFSWTGKSGSETLTGVPDLDNDYSVGTDVHETEYSLAMVGTKGADCILSDKLFLRVSGTRSSFKYYSPHFSHQVATPSTSASHYETAGGVISAQMLVKPTFNIVNNSGGITVPTSSDNKVITFVLNSDTEHAWLSYMPNLTGYYLVSEDFTDDIEGNLNIRTSPNADMPKKIHKIVNHSVSVAPSTTATETQEITLDSDFSSSNGARYRLMRPSEVTFDEHENEVRFNVLLNDGKGRDWRTGGSRQSNATFSESVNHMYLLLDIDNAHSTIERRTGTDAIAPFSDLTDGDILDMNITDGTESVRKNIVVRKTVAINDGENQQTKTGLTLEFDGKLSANGVVSFGEVFEVTLGRKPKLKDITKCSIGTTYAIASQLEKEVENIVTLAGLEYNPSRSFSNPTGNIVNSGTTMLSTGVIVNGNHHSTASTITVDGVDATTIFAEGDSVFDDSGTFLGFVSSTTATAINLTAGHLVAISDNENLQREGITCTSAIEGISVGDVVYSYDGHLIGEVALAGVSGSTIALRNRYFSPAQYDELVLVNKKTFATNLKFDNTNMYNALNSLVVKRGLDYNIKNGEFITRNIEDTGSLRRYALSYKESNRLISVKGNTSMFDKANKIVVVGDKVQYELEKPTKKQTRTVKVVDPTIKSRVDAETKAVELMNIYDGDARKIDIELQKEGLELLEAGDILRMNFPNHNIPVNDYIVFEIENVLSGTLKLKVGTFDKTIAERLSELSMQQADDSTTLLGRDAVVESSGKFLFDAIKLKNISFSYNITGPSNALSRNSNMGFDDIVGFTEEVGFEHSIVTKKSYKDRFYEQEDY